MTTHISHDQTTKARAVAGMPDASAKYRPYPPVDLPDRTWPSNAITKAPSWCSATRR